MPRVERRTFLALGAAAVGLAGCTSDPAEPDGTPTPTAPDVQRDPDAALRDEVAASEIALIAAYRSALEAHPDLSGDLAPFLAHHEAHLARVSPGSTAGAGTPPASTSHDGSTSPRSSGLASPAPSGSPSGPASGGPAASDAPQGSSAPDVDAQPSSAAARSLAMLAASESLARAQRAAACDRAVDPGLARDLCLVAASEAQHAALLDGLADEEASS
jgi:hypothetical protein